jgi:hypothetical protein
MVRALKTIGCAGLALAFWGGCSSSESDPDAAVETETHIPGPICWDLASTCHTVDPGMPGELHDCHVLGHESSEEECEPEHDRCLALCQAALDAASDGGAPEEDGGDPGAGGHPSDGGARDGGSGGSGTIPDAGADGSASGGSASGGGGAGGGGDGGSEHSGGSGGTDTGVRQCAELGTICHAVDDGDGPIHDCHTLGHDNDPEVCAENYTRCRELCLSAAEH